MGVGEVPDHRAQRVRRFELGEVTALAQQFEARAGNGIGVRAAVVGVDDPVGFTPEHERGAGAASQPAAKRGIGRRGSVRRLTPPADARSDCRWAASG